MLTARFLKFYRCAALVAGQAMHLVIAGNFLIKVLLQVNAVNGLVALADGRDDLVFQFCLIQCALQLFLLGFFFFYNVINVAEAQQHVKAAMLGVYPDGLPIIEFMPVAVRHAGVVEIRSLCVLQAGFYMGAGKLLDKLLLFILRQERPTIRSCKVVKRLVFFLAAAQQAICIGFFGNLQDFIRAGVQIDIIHRRIIAAQLIKDLLIAANFVQVAVQLVVLCADHKGQHGKQHKKQQYHRQHDYGNDRVQLYQHSQRHIGHLIAGVAGGDIFNRAVGYGINCLGQDTRHRVVDMRCRKDAALKRGSVQQAVHKAAAGVIVDKLLRHIVVDKSCIRFSAFDCLHCLLPTGAQQLFGVGRIDILNAAESPLLNRCHSLDIAVKIAAHDLGALDRDIRCAGTVIARLYNGISFDSPVQNQIHAARTALQGCCHILVPGGAKNKLIGQAGIICQLSEIIGQDALHLAVFQIGVGLAGRVAQDAQRCTRGAVTADDLFFLVGKFKISFSQRGIVPVKQFGFPVALGGVELVYGVVDLIQQRLVALFYNDVDILTVEPLDDPLIACGAHGAGNDGIHLPLLQRFLHFADQPEIYRGIAEILFLGELLKIGVAGVAAQHSDPQPVIGAVILRNNGVVVTAHGHHTFVVADGARIIKLLLPFRGFAGGGTHINFAVFEHLLGFAPALVVAHIFILDIPVPRHHTQQIIAVAALVAGFVHHMVAVHGKKADTHMVALVGRIVCRRNVEYKAGKQCQQQRKSRKRFAPAGAFWRLSAVGRGCSAVMFHILSLLIISRFGGCYAQF